MYVPYMYKNLPSEGCWRLAMRYGYGYDQEPDTMELVGVFSFFFLSFLRKFKRKMDALDALSFFLLHFSWLA